jgi:Glycolipid transfer protein (GLTP)
MVFERIALRRRPSVEEPAMAFEFDNLVCAFEAVSFDYRSGPDGPALPKTKGFMTAMSEVSLFFEVLGTGFTFVRRDISSKVAVIEAHRPFHDDLTDAVLADVKDGVAGPSAPEGAEDPTVTRTLLRLMWATRFIEVLMRELARTYTPAPGDAEVTLYDAVSTAYSEALADKHPWGLRRAVAAALYLLPTKDVFVQKLHIDSSRFEEYLKRLNGSLGPLIKRTYSFYDLHKLHDK